MTSNLLTAVLHGFAIVAFATPLGLCWRLHRLLEEKSQKILRFYIVATAVCLGPALLLLQVPYLDAHWAAMGMEPPFFVDLFAAFVWVFLAGPVWVFGSLMTIVVQRLSPKLL